MSRTVELLRLVQVCRKIEGRKKLQKIVHILREAGYPFHYRYSFHLHGPFSAELKRDIDLFSEENLLDERESTTRYGEFAQYEYRPTDQTNILLSELEADSEPVVWSSLAVRLNEKSAQELEAISTILYLLRSGTKRDELKARFESLKPQLSSNYQTAESFALEIANDQVPA